MLTGWINAQWSDLRLLFQEANKCNYCSWLQFKSLIISDCVLLVPKVLGGMHQSLTLLLCFSLWAEHGRYSSGFSYPMSLATLWLAKTAGVAGSLEHSIDTYSTQLLLVIITTQDSPCVSRWHQHYLSPTEMCQVTKSTRKVQSRDCLNPFAEKQNSSFRICFRAYSTVHLASLFL